MTEPRVTYSFGPLERRGLLGPLQAGQALIMTVGVVVAISLLDLYPSPGGALGALLTVAGAGTVSFAPVGRRSLQEWIPVAGAFAVRRLTGHHRFHSTTPTLGSVAVITSRRPGARNKARDPVVKSCSRVPMPTTRSDAAAAALAALDPVTPMLPRLQG